MNGKDLKGRKLKCEVAHRTMKMKAQPTLDESVDLDKVPETIPQAAKVNQVEVVAPVEPMPSSVTEIAVSAKNLKRERPIETSILNEKALAKDTIVIKSKGPVSSEEAPAVPALKAVSTKVKPSLQLIVMGVPMHVDKKSFKKTMAKISRKSYVELIKEVSSV
jgi:hypothetical protein